MRFRPALAAILAMLLASPALAQEAPAASEKLEAELKAQIELNRLLQQRVAALEAELEAAREGQGQVQAEDQPAPPPITAEDPEQARALERSFVRRGAAVLPGGMAEISPRLGWSHDGSGNNSSDSLFASLDGRAGLGDGWMVGANLPFLYREAGAAGSNAGLGDPTITAWKSLQAPDQAHPSFVASLAYTAPLGEAEQAVPTGAGFHLLTARLSTVRSIDPIALYGEVSFTQSLGDSFDHIDVERGASYGFGAGASLAVTPDISMSAGLDFTFSQDIAVNGVTLPGSGQTIGLFEIGAGFVLRRNLFLTVGGAFGVTADSPDATLLVSLPLRF